MFKKTATAVLVSLAAACVRAGGFQSAISQVNSYSEAPSIPAPYKGGGPAKAAQLCEDYDSCRAAFKAGEDVVRSFSEKVPGNVVEIGSLPVKDLSVDYIYCGLSDAALRSAGPKTRGLLVLVSGVHGIEGMLGSNAQGMFVNSMLGGVDLSKTGVLLVHAVNPWGMKNHRKVTEENIDLNRHFLMPGASISNPEYIRYDSLMVPKEPLNRSWCSIAWRDAAIANASRDAKFVQAVLGGQSVNPKGIYYSNEEALPVKGWLERLLTRKAEGSGKVLVIDFHTGVGENGVFQLFPEKPSNPLVDSAMKAIFEGEVIGIDTSYSAAGDFAKWTSDLLTTGGRVAVGMTAEFGTLGTHIIAQLHSLRFLIEENQMRHNGLVNEGERSAVVKNFYDLYWPSDAGWREKSMKQTAEKLPKFIRNFEQFQPSVPRHRDPG
jgi:hypothetical protein